MFDPATNSAADRNDGRFLPPTRQIPPVCGGQDFDSELLLAAGADALDVSFVDDADSDALVAASAPFLYDSLR